MFALLCPFWFVMFADLLCLGDALLVRMFNVGLGLLDFAVHFAVLFGFCSEFWVVDVILVDLF